MRSKKLNKELSMEKKYFVLGNTTKKASVYWRDKSVFSQGYLVAEFHTAEGLKAKDLADEHCKVLNARVMLHTS